MDEVEEEVKEELLHCLSGHILTSNVQLMTISAVVKWELCSCSCKF